jgi:predicted ATPase
MLRLIHLKNFRAFRELEIAPFNRVNLIAGLNNAGKTGLMEAILLGLTDERLPKLLSSPQKLPNVFRVFSAHGDPNENFWPWLFHDKRRDLDIEIRLSFQNGTEELAVFSFNTKPKLPAYPGLQHVTNLGPIRCFRSNQANLQLPQVAVFSSHPSDPKQDAIDYNRVIAKRGRRKIEQLLSQVDPRLQAIESLQTGNAPLLYADIGLPEMIPVTHLGEGFCRLLDIYSELLAGDAKVLLIDELENGLHHSVLPTVWKGLIAAANELDVQIFATTHSAECINAADFAARETEPYELNLIRLDRVKGEIKATVMQDETIATARQFNWELR